MLLKKIIFPIKEEKMKNLEFAVFDEPDSSSENRYSITNNDKWFGPAFKRIDEADSPSVESSTFIDFNDVAKIIIMRDIISTKELIQKEQQPVPDSSLTVTEAIKCPSCGVGLEKVNKYCHKCGVKLEDNATSQIQVEKIIWAGAFYKGLCNLIYSDSGGFKSMFSKFIGSLPMFKKCLFIILDSCNKIDLSRYSTALGEKAIIISQKVFQQKTDELEDAKEWQIFMEGIMVYRIQANQSSEERRFEEILHRVRRKYRSEKHVSRIDEIDVLRDIIIEAISMDVDFICIDSLNALIGDSRKPTRKMIQRILHPARENEITFLCIHHTNKAGLLAGSSGIIEEFDYVGRLSTDTFS